MRISNLECCTNMYLKIAGITPANRVKLTPRDLLELFRYSKGFFRTAPSEACLAASLSGPKRLSRNGFEMVLAAILDIRQLNIPFVSGYIWPGDNFVMNIVRSTLSELTRWSRRYVNEMPKNLKMQIFSQKLLAQSGYAKFMVRHPNYQLVDLHDFSSGRYTVQRSVYKLVFRDRISGEEASYILKPPVEIDLVANKSVNEEFYSRYLSLFDRNPANIHIYDGLSFVEFIEGIQSNELSSNYSLAVPYAHLADELLIWFAQEAALADAVSKGDRLIGFKGVRLGNYIIVLDKTGEKILRMVSVDHEYIFVRTDDFTIESAENGLLEMCFLAILSEFADVAGRRELFGKFKKHYEAMNQRIRGKEGQVKDLIRNYYGEEEIEIFETNLSKDIDAWLEMLFEKVETFWNSVQA